MLIGMPHQVLQAALLEFQEFTGIERECAPQGLPGTNPRPSTHLQMRRRIIWPTRHRRSIQFPPWEARLDSKPVQLFPADISSAG